MKKLIYSILSLGILLIPIQLLSQESKTFIHVSDTNNVFENYTKMDIDELNENPNQTPIMVHRYNVGKDFISYVNEKQGLWYNAISKKWCIFNQKKTDFKTNSAYNILVPGPDMKSFTHETTVGNSKFDYTVLDDNAINNNPNSVILVNDVYDGKYNVHVLNVGFHQATGKWRIYYADDEDMQIGVKFNVVVALNGQANYGTIIHTSTQSNNYINRTILDNPNLNDNPDAMVFVTQIKPQGTDNIKNIGVYYFANRWQIYNETDGKGTDGFEMPEDVQFNVVYFPNKKQSNATHGIEKNEINVFPNPVSNQEDLHINLKDMMDLDIIISLSNSAGQIVINKNLDASEIVSDFKLALNGIEKGLYFLKIETTNGTSLKKVMIN